jgi:hypothetical protein
MTPDSVSKENELEVWANLYEHVIYAKRRTAKYKVGQRVRISEKRLDFYLKATRGLSS